MSGRPARGAGLCVTYGSAAMVRPATTAPRTRTAIAAANDQDKERGL
ncbi:hypothetical protein AB0478_05595 [Streptomyces sp. NPDC051917]